VCAEILDLSWDLTGELRALVTAHMLHGPYEEDNLRALCMVLKYLNGLLVCLKGFLKPFLEQTVIYKDSYLEYCRRDNSETFTVLKPGFPGQEVVRDNCWVVLYNPYLL
jgi:hypothetical protein